MIRNILENIEHIPSFILQPKFTEFLKLGQRKSKLTPNILGHDLIQTHKIKAQGPKCKPPHIIVKPDPT